jgi:phenylpyruvate tautomerase PptA (4-oxalocrotonate tautomerase family)
MPPVTIKMFENELSETQAKDLIKRVTEGVIPFVDEKLRNKTWVLIEEVNSGSWPPIPPPLRARRCSSNSVE